MSRQRKLIAKRAKELGIAIDSLIWEPVHGDSCKCGPMGGWKLETTDGHIYFGLNVNKLLVDMEYDMMLTSDALGSTIHETVLRQAFPVNLDIEPE